jgi:hypothetical protein
MSSDPDPDPVTTVALVLHRVVATPDEKATRSLGSAAPTVAEVASVAAQHFRLGSREKESWGLG